MEPVSGPEHRIDANTSRRGFLRTTAAIGASFVAPACATAQISKLDKPITLGLIADLHQDVMHDGPRRLAAFLDAMKQEQSDAILQLGDFAYPTEANQHVTEAFAGGHPRALHVLGNHEIDGGHSFDEVVKLWDMPGRYYVERIDGLSLIVLDGNERPPNHQGGYPAHIGPEQLEWLASQLKELDGPGIVFCHQPLAGPSSVDNADQVQEVLNSAAEKVLLTVNGHTHIDHLVRVGKIINLHVNSASYFWVGGRYKHLSYADEIHAAHSSIQYTCPYADPLFTMLTVNPANQRIELKSAATTWVGKSPAELGMAFRELTDGEEIVPQIRGRSLARPTA